MDVSGKIWVFPKKLKTKDGEFTLMETSLSNKVDDEYKDKYSMRVYFADSIMPQGSLKKFKEEFAYKMEIKGFLSTRGYDGKDGKRHVEPCVRVTEAKTLEKKAKKVKPKEEEPAKPKIKQETPQDASEQDFDDLPF